MIVPGTGACKRGHDRSVTGVYSTSYGAQPCVVCERQRTAERRRNGAGECTLTADQRKRLRQAICAQFTSDVTEKILALGVARESARQDEKREYDLWIAQVRARAR